MADNKDKETGLSENLTTIEALNDLINDYDEKYYSKRLKNYGKRVSLVMPQSYDASLTVYEVISSFMFTLDSEIKRAIKAERLLAVDLDDEIDRAKKAEDALKDSLEDETVRAKIAENGISEKLLMEIDRAKTAEKDIQTAINAEAERAKSAENTLKIDLIDKINIEQQAREDADTAINENVTNLQTKVETDKVKPFFSVTPLSIMNPELDSVITFNINLPNSTKTDEIVFFTNVSCNNNYIPVISQTYTHDSKTGNINIVVTAKVNYIPDDTTNPARYNCAIQGFMTNTK